MSLFDTLMDGEKTGEVIETPVTSEEPTWWWDETNPGSGIRPDWLPEKFSKVSEMGKSYAELQTKQGVAPEKYDFTAGKEWIEPEYEAIIDLAEYAKSKSVPQDVMDRMLSAVGKYLSEFKPNFEEEMSLLGENAKERLNVLNNWAKSNLSEDSYYALTNNMRSADAVQALEEIRTKMLNNNTVIPNANTDSIEMPLSIDDIHIEIADNLEKYNKDPKYRNEITRKIESIINKG